MQYSDYGNYRNKNYPFVLSVGSILQIFMMEYGEGIMNSL